MEATIKIKKVDNGYQYEFNYTVKDSDQCKKHEMVFTNAEHLLEAIKQHTRLYFPTEG